MFPLNLQALLHITNDDLYISKRKQTKNILFVSCVMRHMDMGLMYFTRLKIIFFWYISLWILYKLKELNFRIVPMTKKLTKDMVTLVWANMRELLHTFQKKITKAFRMKFRIKLRRNDIAHSIWTCILQGLKFTIHVLSI